MPSDVRDHEARDHRRRQRFAQRLGLLVVGIAAVVLIVVALPFGRGRSTVSSTPISGIAAIGDLPAPDLVVDNPGYVGPRVCAECHEARCVEFHGTRHAMACPTPEEGRLSPPFAGETLASVHPGRSFRMSVIDDRPTVEITDSGRALPSRVFSVDLTDGLAGTGDEVYFSWQGDRLFELPVAWIPGSKSWAEHPSNRSDPGSVPRTATPRCVECHTTWIQHVLGTENEYRREGMIRGVTCEKCHGPAAEHVAFHREHPRDMEGHGLVVPSRLPRDRQLDVCGQCHSNALHGLDEARPFRPGDRLEDHFRTLHATGPENDHVADQVKYLRQSACFGRSDTMTCTTCHDPHRPPVSGDGDRSCLQCHQPQSCTEAPRLPDGVLSGCVACHMPTFNRVAVTFHAGADRYFFPVRPHEHRIGVYPHARDEVVLEHLRGRGGVENAEQMTRLAGTLFGHWMQEAQRYRDDGQCFAAIGALREAVRFDTSGVAEADLATAIADQTRFDDDLATAGSEMQSENHVAAAEILRRLLDARPRDARVAGKLGTLNAVLGRRSVATELLERVEEIDPDDAYGRSMLGWLAFLDGRFNEAAEHYRIADSMRPNSAEILYRWGLSLLKLNDWPGALDRFAATRRADPRHAGSHQGAAHALSKTGHHDEAIAHARRAAELTGWKNADVLLTFAEACAGGGYLEDAIDVGRKALTVAAETQPQLVPMLRTRLDQWDGSKR